MRGRHYSISIDLLMLQVASKEIQRVDGSIHRFSIK